MTPSKGFFILVQLPSDTDYLLKFQPKYHYLSQDWVHSLIHMIRYGYIAYWWLLVDTINNNDGGKTISPDVFNRKLKKKNLIGKPFNKPLEIETHNKRCGIYRFIDFTIFV